MQASLEKPFRFRGRRNVLHGKPRSHRSLHRTGDRQICSAGRDLPKYRPRDHDFAEKVAKQLEIAQSGKIHERAGVGDDQGLPDLASSFEFADGVGVRFPVFRSVDDVGDATLLQQVHERQPLQAELVGGLACRDLAIGEKG